MGAEYATLLGLIFQIRIESITMDVLGTGTAVLNHKSRKINEII